LYRFTFFTALVYGLLLAGLITLRGEMVALAIPFVLVLLYSLWNTPELPNLRVERKFSNDRAVPGSDVTVTLTIENLGRNIDELLFEDRISSNLSVRLGSPRHLLRLSQGGLHTVTYTIAGPRGAYSFDSVRLESTDFLGLIRRTRTIPVPGQLLVFPRLRRLRSISIRPHRTRVYAGAIPARAGGTGTEFFGVREYMPGDPPRVINWRASARHIDALYSNEFQQERVADVGIVLDARERANLFHGTHSIFEHSILAAAALSDAFLAQGNRVGLLIYGSYLGWTLPDYGKIQRERIMQSLARARVGVSSVFAGLEHLSARMFPPESQIVLVSSLVNDDLNVMIQLRARGYQVMVISPDPIKFEHGLLPSTVGADLAVRVVRMERDLLIRRLERAGIQVIEWDLSRQFDQAVGPILMRPHAQRSIVRRMA
jgi:uncharacterized protein (DUF58 family)